MTATLQQPLSGVESLAIKVADSRVESGIGLLVSSRDFIKSGTTSRRHIARSDPDQIPAGTTNPLISM